MSFSQHDADGTRCVNLQHADLGEKDIEAILHWHNIYRNTVANGHEERGNPGPQRPAKFMMELVRFSLDRACGYIYIYIYKKRQKFEHASL